MMTVPPKMRLALIATYPKMSEIFMQMTQQEGIEGTDIFACFEEASECALKIAPNVDAILSRGGTGAYIQRAVDIPVIIIPITSFDVVQALYKLNKTVKEVALFNYQQHILGISNIEKMFNVTIHEYAFEHYEDLEKNIIDVKNKNIEVVIGGMVAVPIAKRFGLTGIELSAGEETVYRAIQEAKHVIQIRNSERMQNTIYNAIFNSIGDGIIFTNTENKIEFINPVARKIFSLGGKKLQGKSVVDFIPNTRIPEVLKSGNKELNFLQNVGEMTIMTNRIPLMFDNKQVGVVCTFQDITKIQHLEQKIRREMQAKGFVAKYHFDDIITCNDTMKKIKKIASIYAKTSSAILIEGESGTGKELFAQSIHNASDFCNGPFVAVNCAALPEDLLESLLFGYEGGTFTGARKEGKSGLFELAHNGTIFLDEIGEISNSLQARLLRVLQEKEVMRVGGDKNIPINIRVISATNKNLLQRINNREFRSDLYYRLNVFNIAIPPLRLRTEDVIYLLEAFMKKMNIRLSEELKQKIYPCLVEYNWPGNVRELQNVVERLGLLAGYEEQVFNDQEFDFGTTVFKAFQENSNRINMCIDISNGLKTALAQAEKDIIQYLLSKFNDDQQKVADYLGISHTSLWRKRKDLMK